MARLNQRTIGVAHDEGVRPSGFVVREAARELRRSLRPVAWLVLEELMFDAVDVDGELVVATSARSIAAELRLDPGTVASALRVLRQRGLVELARPHGPCGRFGLSTYRLLAITGLAVLALCADSPREVKPTPLDAHVARRNVGVTRTRRRTRSRCEQTALDLGLGTK
jgi:hypothetical protein